jgi:ADP-ribosylglycohydrolase
MNANAATNDEIANRIAGLILGTALGDALGLPREGLSPRRAARIFGDGPIRHALLGGRGMISDDTEHTCMAAQALIGSGGEVEGFTRDFARRLRWWFAAFPAGAGKATIRACLKLWVGIGPQRSGVTSAGNGPAMRSAVLAVASLDDVSRLRALVRASTRITHTDPRAEEGAVAIALAARAALLAGASVSPREVLIEISSSVEGSELRAALATVIELIKTGAAPVQALRFERGVSGYINNTVPAALYCWARWPVDFRAAVEAAIRLGGDTDTTGAITGALVGATVGAGQLPTDWLTGLRDWPCTTEWMRKLALTLSNQMKNGWRTAPERPARLSWPASFARNVAFLLIVLAHGLRRLLPPY